jgi:hypothetical protein
MGFDRGAERRERVDNGLVDDRLPEETASDARSDHGIRAIAEGGNALGERGALTGYRHALGEFHAHAVTQYAGGPFCR